MEKKFKTAQEMSNYLTDLKNNRQSVSVCYINEIKLKELANVPILLPAVKSNMGFTASEEDIGICMAETGIMATLPVNGTARNIPVYPTALFTLCDRAKLYGTTTRLHPLVLNEGFQYYNEECQLLIQDGMLLASHSKDYSFLPLNQLFDCLTSGLDADFPGFVFAEGTYSPEMTSAYFEMPKHSIPFGKNGEVFVPALLFTSNDVAMCGANLHGMLVKEILIGGTKRKVKCRLGEKLCVTHKSGHTIGDFANNVDQVFSILKNGKSKLDELDQINLQYPEQCFMNLVKEYKLPRREAEEALEDFKIRRGLSVSANELYWALWTIMVYFKDISLTRQLDIEEQLTRTLNCDWEKFDVPFAI